MPNFSCLIPAHNAEATIRQCVESALVDFDEVIVYADGCTDRTVAICQSIAQNNPKGQNFRVINKDAGNGSGQPVGDQVARNILWKEAKGDYVTWLDSDDFRIVNTAYRQASQLQVAQANGKKCIASIGHFVRYYKEPYPNLDIYRDIPDSLDGGFWELFIDRRIQVGAILWDARLLRELQSKEDVGVLWDVNRKRLKEYWLVTKALLHGFEFDVLNEHVTFYRQGWNEGQLSNLCNHAVLYYNTERVLSKYSTPLIPPEKLDYFKERSEGIERMYQKLIRDQQGMKIKRKSLAVD